MSTQHPRLTRALTELSNGNAAPVVAIGLGARVAQDEGRYCECPEPLLTPPDLMCGACLLNNRNMEIAAVLRIVTAHEFLADDTAALPMCAICTGWEHWPRHHGEHAVGRTSWGAEVRPA